jgi:hypothetical protein
MKTINVARAFSLILKGGEPPVTVPAGVQQVEDAIAEHWYTKLHLANGGFGTVEYAKATRAKADEAFHKAKALVDEYHGLERAAQEAEAEAKLDPVEPAYVRFGLADADEAGLAGQRVAPKPVTDAPKDDAKADAKPKRGGRAPKAAPAADTAQGGQAAGGDAGAGQTGDTSGSTSTDAPGGQPAGEGQQEGQGAGDPPPPGADADKVPA